MADRISGIALLCCAIFFGLLGMIACPPGEVRGAFEVGIFVGSCFWVGIANLTTSKESLSGKGTHPTGQATEPGHVDNKS